MIDMDVLDENKEKQKTEVNTQKSKDDQSINEPTISEVSSFFNEEIQEDEAKTSSNINFLGNTFGKSTIAGNIEYLEVHYGSEQDIPEFNEVEEVDLEALEFKVQNIARKYTILLQKEKMLILNCAHHDIAINLKHHIAQSADFNSYKKYEMASDDNNNVKIQYLVDCARKGLKLKENEKLLLFIHDNDEAEIPPLLASIEKKTQNGKSSILSHLKAETYIIYITYHKDIRYLDKSVFDFQNVNVFDIYTNTYNFSETDIALLKQQLRNGIWSMDMKKLLLDLDKVKPNFSREISRREEEPQIEFLPIIKNKKKPIARYVLFVASFFSELTPSSFRAIVSLLLSDKKILKKKKEILLKDIWENDPDEIIDDCRLETYKRNNQYYVDFASSAESEKCEEILFNKAINFVDQQARYLIEGQKLFTTASSLKDHNSVFPIIARLANSFKNYYGGELLKKWLFLIEVQQDECDEYKATMEDLKSYKNKIKRLMNTLKKFQFTNKSLETLRDIAAIHIKKKYDDLLRDIDQAKFFFYKEELFPQHASISGIINELSALDETILEELDNINAKKNSCNYYLRRNIRTFVDLLVRIQKEDTSKEVVSLFFEDAFKTIYHNYTILQILNEYQIRNKISSFFENYKFCLTNNDKKVNEKSIISLITFFVQEPSEFYSSLNEVSNWLPETTKSVDVFTQLEKNVLQCICSALLIFVDNDQHYIQDKKVIASPSYCALFEDVERMKNHLETIVNSLLCIHKDEEKSANEFFQYIEYWYYLLQMVRESMDEVDNIEQKIQIFQATIQKVLDASHRKRVLIKIKEVRAIYNEQIGDIIDRKEEELLKKKRAYLTELTTILKH